MSKEIKTALIALVAIGLLIAGINFLKGNSFFGGDDRYYAYFPNSGGVTPSSSVMINGVAVGKVVSVDIQQGADSVKSVLISFNITESDFKLSKDWDITVGAIDFFNKGMLIQQTERFGMGNYKPGDTIMGIVASDIATELKGYVDPIMNKVQHLAGSVDKMVTSLNAFWDTSATSAIETSMNEVQVAITRFGNVAREVELMVQEERQNFSRIMVNVESISKNLKESNAQVSAIIGNTKKITDDMVSADFKGTIEKAKQSLDKVNNVLAEVENGNGTLGKLLKDEALYNELIKTNASLQNLINDLQLHPERYINFSVVGRKTKGVTLTPDEERKMREILEKTPD